MDINLDYAKLSNKEPLGQGSSTTTTLANEAVLDFVPGPATMPDIPYYLKETYYWAYVSPRNVALLDREIVVSTILWGQHLKLQRAAFSEILPGQHVLQPAAVYGNFGPDLARHIGENGKLEISDINPIQVAGCGKKLHDFPHARARLADARNPGGGPYDVVCCYFLMHELPEDYKRDVMDGLLSFVAPGGKLVFVDYHKPHWAHPIKPITSLVFDFLEPFAKSLWHHEIEEFAANRQDYNWRKQTYFGGLFQKVVATRKS